MIGKAGRIAALALGTLLVWPSVALADTVENNVVNDTTDVSLVAGNLSSTATVGFKVVGTSADGETGCNVDRGESITFSISTPSGITASPSSISFGGPTTGPGFVGCDTFQDVVFSAGAGAASGNVTLSISSSTTGAGTYDLAPATFFITVSQPPPTDSTPPVISKTITPTPNAAGWNNSLPVVLDWTVTDPDSAFTITSGCVDETFSSETAGETRSCQAQSAGGSASDSVTIKIDTTKPIISGQASPAPNSSGWNNSNVTVAFDCADSGSVQSGIATDTVPNATLSTNGAGQSATSTGDCRDAAGNSADAVTVSGINIDKDPPTVSVTGVSDGASYTKGSVPAAGCDTQDQVGLSGVKDTATLTLTGGNANGVGSFTATCSGASDYAGNASSPVSATYTVVYPWNGFFRPVDNLPTMNVVKAGSAVPIKFSLSGDEGLSIFATGYPKSSRIDCSTLANLDAIEETVTAGGSSLSYDSSIDQYNYVWKTDKAWAGTCRQLEVKLNDGTSHLASFKLTK